jgi:hypothetical protein
MKRKYSRKLMYNAAEFLRTANEELEDGLGEQQVYAMLDAFDPALKRQLLMEMLMGHIGGALRVRAFRSEGKQKITAIKEIRGATGLGLKQAKEVVDTADTGIAEIEGDWDRDTYNTLARGLRETGYELV